MKYIIKFNNYDDIDINKKDYYTGQKYNINNHGTSGVFKELYINDIFIKYDSDLSDILFNKLNKLNKCNIEIKNERFDIYFISIIDYQYTKRYHIYIIDHNNPDALIDLVYVYDTDGITATHYYSVQRNGITLFNNNDIDIKEIIENDNKHNLLERLINMFEKLI